MLRTRDIDTVIDWLEHGAKPWPEYESWRREEDRRLTIERMREGFFPWEDVDACRGQSRSKGRKPLERASRCPQCEKPAAELTWIYFQSPAWTWEHLCGRSGWMTVCDDCRLQTAFFVEMMN